MQQTCGDIEAGIFKLTMSTWLITGAAGFIGRNFVRLIHAIYSGPMILLDALTYAGNVTSISNLIDSEKVQFMHGDVRDRQLLRDLFLRETIFSA